MQAHSQEWSSLRLQFLGWPSSKLPLCPSSDSTLLVSKVLTGYFNSLMTKLTRDNAQSNPWLDSTELDMTNKVLKFHSNYNTLS